MDFSQSTSDPVQPRPSGGIRSALLGGLVPVLLFTFVEEYYGTLWGLIAGMVFGIGEIIWEKLKQGKVELVTWIGNGLILVLGGISLATSEGIWFKLQPSLIEGAMALLCIGSVVIGKPFLGAMAKKQGAFAQIPDVVRPLIETRLAGLTFRFGLFFLAHALLAAYAALYWSTKAWMLLKGIGFTVTVILYGLVEVYFLRQSLIREIQTKKGSP